MQPVRSRKGRRPRWLILALIAVNFLVALVGGGTIWLDVVNRRETAAALTRELAVLVANQMVGYFDAIDLELRTIADAVAFGRPFLGPFVDQHRARLPGVAALEVFDAEGRRITPAPGDAARPGDDVADALLTRLRQGADAGYSVSGPFAAKDASDRVLVLARRVVRSDGSLAGMVWAVLPSATLERMLAGAVTEPGYHVSLINDRFEFIARHPMVPSLAGAAISTAVSEPLRRAIATGADHVAYQSPSRLDNQDRVSVAKRVPGLPLVLSVGVAVDQFADPWRIESLLVVAMMLVFPAFSLALSGLLLRAWAATDRAMTAIEEANHQVGYHARRLDLVLRGTNDGWWDWDLATGQVCVSPRWWQMLGMAPEACDGQPKVWRGLIHPGDRARVKTLQHELFTGGQTTFQVEMRLRHIDGHYLPVLTRGHVERDPRGRPLRVSGANTDLSDLRRAETTLRVMFDLLPLGLCRCSAGGVILEVNDAMLAMAASDRAGLVGMALSGLIPALGGENGVLPCQPGGFGPIETDLVRLDAATIPVRLRGVLIQGGDGRDIVLTVIEDISAQREVMRTLEDQSRDLVRSNADLEQFAYVASHDLREPLRMVSSFLGLLERRYQSQLDEEGRQFIAYAREGAQRMDRLILDLLDFSRVGRSGTVMRPVRLRSALDQALVNLLIPAREAGARIDIAQILDDAVVRGEPGQLISLFQNLVGNALKYRDPDRMIEISIEGRRDNGMWEVRVIDNGIGIEPQYFDRIFRLFHRLHTRDRFEGTGIGLALCRKIVEVHDGRIWVDSVPRRGSVFSVVLPASADSPA